MAEQTMTSTPVAAPDVLMNQPLSRQMDVDIESTILEPVSHNYNTTNGGTTTWILPAKGILRARDALIRFQLTSAEGNNLVGYNFAVGGAGCINNITARCGGTIISQAQRVGHYMNIKQNFMEHEKKVGILDARHCSSHDFELNVANAKIATGSADLAYQQLYNPECDQVNGLGNAYNGGVATNGHQLQISKCLSNVALQSPEVIVRLGDLFEIFNENDLPTMGMAQIEITIEWNPCGDPLAAVGAGARLDNVVIDAAIPGVIGDAANAAPNVAQRGTVTMDTPTMLLDYIHYPQEEQQKIVDSINSPGGLRINFSEVLYTRGINPEAAGTGQVTSNHILGMAMKEVKKIYVAKNYDNFTAQGIAELNADFNGVKTHRNILTNQFRSQQIPGEAYNFFINNNRVYDTDVSNPAVAHDYLSQCSTNFRVPGIYYDTTNYNANKTRILLDTEYSAGAQAAASINAARSKQYLAGSCNYIGLNLDKYNSLGSAIGNGTRIGSSPIEFNFNRLAIAAGGDNGGHRAQVDLDFYIVYRRSLVIRPLGVDVSDA